MSELMEDTSKKLNQEEMTVLKEMTDHRYVEQTLKDAFMDGGLSEFRKFIINQNSKISDKHEKLAALLRGNDNKIIVYKDNHKIWELSATKKECIVRFDFNHARYTREWEKELQKLKKMGFELSKSKKSDKLERLPEDNRIKIKRNKNNVVIGGSIGYITCRKGNFDKKFVNDSYKIIMSLVENFFKPQEKDYFREAVKNSTNLEYQAVSEITGTGKGVLVEKRWQQRLLFHFNNVQDGYCAYDLEFSQKYPDSDFVKRYAKKTGEIYLSVKAQNIKDKLGTNEPDMLAIRYEDGKPKALVFIEVKSTESACEGDSGVEEHMKGMYNYSKESIFMLNRRKDAYESLCQYKEFGLLDIDKVESIPNDLPIEMVMLFTNANVPKEISADSNKASSIDYFNKEKGKIKKWAKKYNCSVWTTDSNYWSNDIVINVNPFD